jgi:hypothetical protein
MIFSQNVIMRGNNHMRAQGRPGTRSLAIGEPIWPPARWHFTPQPEHSLSLGCRPTRPRAQKAPVDSTSEKRPETGQPQAND